MSTRSANLRRVIAEAQAQGREYIDVGHLADYPRIVDALRCDGHYITFGYRCARITFKKDEA